MKHPKTIEEISAPWMTDVLRGAGILRRATVLAVDVHAIGQGVGFLSGRARVTLTYDQAEEGAPPRGRQTTAPASKRSACPCTTRARLPRPGSQVTLQAVRAWRRARRSGCMFSRRDKDGLFCYSVAQLLGGQVIPIGSAADITRKSSSAQARRGWTIA